LVKKPLTLTQGLHAHTDWYTWTRDAALVLTGIVDSFAHNYSSTLQTTIQNYITAQAKLQGVTNPSGGLANGLGLGEPKFMVGLTQFTGEWGRPQRDGPPLRAIAMIRYARWLVENGYKATAKDVVWPVIKNDLAYTAQYWWVPLSPFQR
jgi:glucoamylase